MAFTIEDTQMAEVLAVYESPVTGPDGVIYEAQAVGDEMRDGTSHWMGWIEFLPRDGSAAIRTPRETTQPNRDDVIYWATGLTPIYLGGALERALSPLVTEAVTPAVPAFDTPAPDFMAPADPVAPTPAVMNPFSVYQKGEQLLRRQLAALSSWHLINIIQAYDLSADDPVVLQQLSSTVLIERIVTAVGQVTDGT
jgi:hypothetical protein